MDDKLHHLKNKRREFPDISTSPSCRYPSASSRRVSRTSSVVSNPTDDIGLSAHRTSSAVPYTVKVTKARRIRLYRNGDVYYEGMMVVLAPEKFRTFDSLLTFINRSTLADPSVLKRVSRSVSLHNNSNNSALETLCLCAI